MDIANSSSSVCSVATMTHIGTPVEHHPDATTATQVRLSQDLTSIRPGMRDDTEHPADLRSICGNSIPSSATIGRTEQHVAREELAKLYPAVHAKLLASKNASLARQASAGFKPAEACIQDFAVVGKVFDLLAELLNNTTEDSGSASVMGEASGLSASLLELQNLYDDTVAKATELCNSAYHHYLKHGHSKMHASRAVYAERGGKLADKYAKSARRFAFAIEKTTTDIQNRLGGDHAKSRWGEFLFDVLVDQAVIPGIASRRGCSGVDVLEHVDSRKLADYRATCGWLRSDMHNDPIASMARHLGQAFYIAKSPPTSVSQGANGGPDHQRAIDPSADDGDEHDAHTSSGDDNSLLSLSQVVSEMDDSSPARPRGEAEIDDSLPARLQGDAGTGVPLPAQSNAGINVETRSLTSAAGDQTFRGSTHTARPMSAGRAIEDSHNTNVSIVGDINITIHVGHDTAQPGNPQSLAFAGNNGLSVQKEGLFARLQTARAAVNSAIDLAQQRAGVAHEPKAYRRADLGAAPAGTNAFSSSTRNGGGRLFLYPERRPLSSTSFRSPGSLSDDVITPQPWASDARVIHDPAEVESPPVLATSDMLVSTHSGPRMFLDVDTSKPFGGLQAPLTLENFPGQLSSPGRSVSSDDDLPLHTERSHSALTPMPAVTAFSIQPWSERAPIPKSQQVLAPVSAPVSAPAMGTVPVAADTDLSNLREPRRSGDSRRSRRTESFRELSQTPMVHVSDNIKSVQDNLRAQFRRIEAAAYRANAHQLATSRPSIASNGSSLESRSGVFGRERLAQPRASRDPGRFTASTHLGSDPSAHPTLIATNLGRQFDVKSSHLRAANPTEEMLSQWGDGAAMPVSEIRSV